MRARLSQAYRTTRNAPALTAFAIALAGAAALALAQEPKFFHYDSGEYWSLSETIAGSGAFPFFEYENNGLRGYALPLAYWALRNAGEVFTLDPSPPVELFNAAVFALIGAVLAPAFAKVAWPGLRWNVTKRLLLTGLLLAFWSGYLSYPLSDFPALAAGLLALIAVARADSPAWLFFAGFATALSLNMRPAYALLAPVLGLLVVWSWLERRRSEPISARRAALCLAALGAGLLLVSLPQSISQHRAYDSYSPIPGSSAGLGGFQYTSGLQLQRYEAYLGIPPRLRYVDGSTAEIRAELGGEGVDGAGGYLGIVAEHPIVMSQVFLRHLLNGMDQRYTTPYVETLEGDRSGLDAAWHLLLRIAGLALAFLALLRVAWPGGRRSLGAARWRYPLALLAVAASAIPAAMETRFMLPVYLLAALVALAPGWGRALAEWRGSDTRRRDLALALGAGAAYAAIAWSVLSAATDSLRLG